MERNEFIRNLQKNNAMCKTANGAAAYNTTFNKVYDLFSLGAAYRQRSDEDCISLFKAALEESPDLALRALFWIGDVRGGAGERRFFYVCFRWLCLKKPDLARSFLTLVPEYTRWDIIIKAAYKTAVWRDAVGIIRNQLREDLKSEHPSLLAKWMPSTNASSQETKNLAKALCCYLGMTEKQYRKTLSFLRAEIKVVERLMSANQWGKIEFDKLPSKAGFNYRKCFSTREETSQRYIDFINSKTTKVNADTLFPYDIVGKVFDDCSYDWSAGSLSATYKYWGDEIQRQSINKYWANQKDYLNGKPCKMICVCDTSGSMSGLPVDAPINIAISLSMYCAERLGGDFHNKFITFSHKPRFIELEKMGDNFVDRVVNIYRTNICEDTNLTGTFALLFEACKRAKKEDRPDTVVVISDMQINMGTEDSWSENECCSTMERIRETWEKAGMKMPKLIYWNVNASRDTFLELGNDVSFVSGASPALFTSILTGKTGYDLMLETLMSERYNAVSQAFANRD